MARSMVFLLTILLALCTFGCSRETAPAPPAVSVTLFPGTATVNVNRSVQFTAVVEPKTNTAVTWSLSADGCTEAACGTVDKKGIYNAPSSLPATPLVTITATSVADPKISASALITLLGPLTITVMPPDVLVTVGKIHWFSALVENAVSDDRVTWSLSGATGTGPEYGTFTDTNKYTAPRAVPADPVVTITATSVEDATVSGSTTATIRPAGFTDIMWTWVSGDEFCRHMGIYGTKGVADPSNVPGAREYAVSWLDPAGNLWLFGGHGPGPNIGGLSFNDLWKYDPATQLWTWVSGSDLGYQAGIYGTKGTADPLNAPGARSMSVSWTDPGGKLWLFGGAGLDSVGASRYVSLGLNDLWFFDLATREWTWASGSDREGQAGVYGTKGIADPMNVPGARFRAASWIDGGGRLWLFGGMIKATTGDCLLLNDLWNYDPATSTWTWISGSDQWAASGEYGTKRVPSTLNAPGARAGAATWIDANGKLWLFGGFGRWGYPHLFNDLWKFDPATLEWTWMSGSDGPNKLGYYGTQGVRDPRNGPGGRSSCVSWLDARGDLWLFGGDGYSAEDGPFLLNDLWRFDSTALEWTWVSGSDKCDAWGEYGLKNTGDLSNFPGARADALSWYDSNGRFWLFGGYGSDSGWFLGDLNDLWHFIRIPPVENTVSAGDERR